MADYRFNILWNYHLNKRIAIHGIILSISAIFLIAQSCGPSGPRDHRAARRAAIWKFNEAIFESRIGEGLFQGPMLIEVNDKEFIFRWYSTVPQWGATIYGATVPKDRNEKITFLHGLGQRKRATYLCGTDKLPVNESALKNLFGLPPNPDYGDIGIRRLQLIPLDANQLNDVANFVEIKKGLRQYRFEHAASYPDSLSEIIFVPRLDVVDHSPLDSFYFADRYGHEYFYVNLIDFVVVGTPGENRKWDIDSAKMDSIYSDDMEHIYTTWDDIIVKFRPR